MLPQYSMDLDASLHDELGNQIHACLLKHWDFNDCWRGGALLVARVVIVGLAQAQPQSCANSMVLNRFAEPCRPLIYEELLSFKVEFFQEFY